MTSTQDPLQFRLHAWALLWRPAGRIVRFVLVHHPIRGTIFLLSTDLTLEPLAIIQLYGYRFKIEMGFRQAVHVIGAYGYHFWMSTMNPIRRGDNRGNCVILVDHPPIGPNFYHSPASRLP